MNRTSSSQKLRHAAARYTLSCAAFLAALSAGGSAYATHFRAGHIEWKHVGAVANHDIEYTVQSAWRQDGISSPSGTAAYRCVDPASFVNQSTKLTTINCTGPLFAGKYNPGVGDVFVELIGGTRLEFGDSSSVGAPGSDPLAYKVTSADSGGNWVFALAIDPNSLVPGSSAVDTTIFHHYSNGNSRTARINDCCRISPCTSPNAHLNNPDTNYQVQAVVNVSGDNSSPTSSLPPIILCQQGGICTFTIPVSDNEVDPFTVRMSTAAEAAFTSQPGPPQCPNDGLHAATVTQVGANWVYSWNTAGCRTAASATPNPPAGGCNNGSLNTLYSTQVMIVEPGESTLTALDFLIQLVPACSLNNSPVFDSPPTPACGSTISAHPNTFMSFPIQGSDPNAGDSVTLNAAGIPSGATLSPVLPTSGNPVNSTFSWTPTAGDLGQHVVTFTIQDPCGVQQLCSISIDVSTEICGNGIDDDNDTKIDCADEDCAGTSCSDGNACTSNDTCSGATQTCVGGAATNCNDSNGCTDDSCNPGSGCVHTNNTASCSDGDACTTSDTCSGGSCAGGAAPNCDDSNACTTDSCDMVLGCQHAVQPNCQPCNQDSDCSNGNACDGAETCVNNQCQAGSPPTCIDGNDCTTDACNPSTGCTYTNNNNPCDDGNACTVSDTCNAGACGGNPLNCNDQNGCTDDSCDQQLGCQHSDNTSPCDDESACTTGDTCSNGSCVGGAPPDCDDANACTTDDCEVEDGCTHTDNTDPCNDGDACTTLDTCSGGGCVGGAAPSCDDGNDCTDDSCNSPTGCAHVNNTSPCEDGSACTTGDMCAAGMCFGGAEPNCDDSNECTSDSCIPASGCANDNHSGSCSDGSACTTNDTCSGGTCIGGAAPDCNDGNGCTTDSCDPGTGCAYTNNNNPCTDNNACTTTDTCSGGLCGAGPALDCSDGNGCTDDSCNPASGCAHADNSAPCNDGSACTTGDFCSSGACSGGPPPDCDDNNVCTDDGCNPGSGCAHANNTSPCSDDNACTVSDTCGGGNCVSGPTLDCNDSNACTTDSCDSGLGCENPPEPNCQPCGTSADCDNQNACDGTESCVSGRCQAGTPPDCDDGNVCTDDGCDAGSGCTHLNNNDPCNDNDACTTADACSGAACTGGPPPNCNDGNVCTTDGCNPGSGCTHPDNTNPCDDGDACTTNDTCGGSTCNGGPAAICNDGNTCTADSCAPASGCQAPAVANGTSCADSSACNGAEACQAGVCTPATPIDCSGSADLCNNAACAEPSGSCVVTPKINGFGCNDLNVCTASDRCQAGACEGNNGADTDGDRYCDSWEVVAGCSPAEFLEIPPQPNTFTGGGSFRRGEVLVAFNAPRQRWIYPAFDPSCATAGVCDAQKGFCSSGRVGDPCGSDGDCDQLANQCRVLINYGDNPNLTLILANYKQRGSRPVDIRSSFSPATPGCSRKVDLSLPSGFRRARVLLKVSGMSDGRVRKERDRLIFLEQP